MERFSGDTRPLVRDLLPAAADLGPTLRDLRDVSPDLRATFRSLDPLIRAGRTGVPALGRTVRGAGPVVEALNPFLDELNPVLSLLGFYQTRIAGFLTNGGAALQGDFGGERYAPNTVLFEPRSLRALHRAPGVRPRPRLPAAQRVQPDPAARRLRQPRLLARDRPAQPLRRRAPERRPLGARAGEGAGCAGRPASPPGPNLYDGTFYPSPRAERRRC